MMDLYELYTLWLRLALALSIYVIVAYLFRLLLSEHIQPFDLLGDWLGQGGQGFGISYMALLLLGKVANLISNYFWSTFFAGSALAFAFRLVRGRSVQTHWDWVHLAMSLSMTYLFWNTSQWREALTFTFCLVYLLLIGYFLKKIALERQNANKMGRIAAFLNASAHVASGIAVLVILIALQWPQLFGLEGGCMQGMAMPGCPFGR